jgi:hypothetical protein
MDEHEPDAHPATKVAVAQEVRNHHPDRLVDEIG